jgi:hypothetical protein
LPAKVVWCMTSSAWGTGHERWQVVVPLLPVMATATVTLPAVNMMTLPGLLDPSDGVVNVADNLSCR